MAVRLGLGRVLGLGSCNGQTGRDMTMESGLPLSPSLLAAYYAAVLRTNMNVETDESLPRELDGVRVQKSRLPVFPLREVWLTFGAASPGAAVGVDRQCTVGNDGGLAGLAGGLALAGWGVMRDVPFGGNNPEHRRTRLVIGVVVPSAPTVAQSPGGAEEGDWSKSHPIDPDDEAVNNDNDDDDDFNAAPHLEKKRSRKRGRGQVWGEDDDEWINLNHFGLQGLPDVQGRKAQLTPPAFAIALSLFACLPPSGSWAPGSRM
ncbi:hypothetical protein LZ30DRAFT_691084 [Colletotrichum cereale]|nr:hypothetical protein LZ30DRAFT_691084 [Colletotrichum cereale]